MTLPGFARILWQRRIGPLDRLRHRRRLFDDAQTLARLGHYEWLPQRGRMLCSDGLCRILGQPLGFSPTPEEWRAIVHPDDREELLRQVDSAKAAGESESAYRIIRPDGEVRYVHGRRYGKAGSDGAARTLFGTIQDVTELRAAERDRRRAQELFETAFSEAPIGMALSALDGRWLRVNRALCEITGWPEHELLKRTFREITHPDDLETSVDSLRRLLDGSISTHDADKRYVSPDGTVIWAHLSLSLVRDAQGRPHHFIAQIQDISERKRHELALGEERLALDEAQRIAKIGSWSWDTRSDDVTWSTQLYRLFGRDPGDGPAVAGDLRRNVHPDDQELVRAEFSAPLARGLPFELDFRVVLPDGAVRTLRAIGKCNPARPHVYVGTVQDVTDLRQAELQARQERDYAAAITRSMRDGFLLTRDGTILEVNQAFCELTGFTREELIGLRIPFPFWQPESDDELRRHAERIARDNHAEFETTYTRRDGTRFPVSTHTVPAEAQDGTLFGLVTTVRDISERKRHEEELNRLATQDPLTGLANHRVLHEQLRAEVARARRQGLRLCVAVLDLDHFKQVNDRYGHPVGDEVLREAGARLRAIVREGETLARVGGEEFAWILTDLDETDAYAAVERARRVIGEMPFAEAGVVTMSAGVAELQPLDAADDLYSRADRALYRAKQNGRNQTVRSGSSEPDALALAIA
jgi:diguanylate cyclase (GGDEF)-like protein/PAS domain S-box-containing protein